MAATSNVAAGSQLWVSGRSRRTGVSVGRIVLYASLVLLAIIFEFPTYWTIATSFKTPPEIQNFPPIFFPSALRWENYVRVFTKEPFGLWIFNTLFVVILATTGAVLTSSIAAYSFARFRYRGRDLFFLITLGTLMLPAQVTLI